MISLLRCKGIIKNFAQLTETLRILQIFNSSKTSSLIDVENVAILAKN